MNNKFEEAMYINGNEHRLYTVEEISNFRKINNTFPVFLNIKNHLFCPECEIPHLSHNECDNSKDYFSTYPNQNHADGCSYTLERASKDEINALKNDNNIKNLRNRLEHCIELLFQNERTEQNPFIITTYNNVHNEEHYGNRRQNRCYIPRKLLTNYIDDNEIGTPKIYYGDCHCKWFKCKDKNNRLCLYHIEQNRLICSLIFYDKAYRFLDDTYKVKEYNAYVAFLSEFESNQVDDKIFYNATIFDSRTVYFLIHE